MTINPILLTALESTLNGYLLMDPHKDSLLAPLAGKVIAVTVRPFETTIYFCPADHAVQVLDTVTMPPDTFISGTPWALGWMGLSSKPMRSIFAGDVTIEGDVHVGRKFQKLFEQLDINLEGKLALFTGDWFADKVGRFFQAGRRWSEHTLETFGLNLSEYLQEESRDLPAPAELEMFYHDVDELRTACDRLDSRLNRLQVRWQGQHATSASNDLNLSRPADHS